MSRLSRIVRNAGVTFIGSNLLRVLSMVIVILIARYLGDVEYGKFTFAVSFTGLFFILMDLGTRILIVREIANNKKDAPKIVANVLMLKLVSSAFAYGVIVASSYLLGYDAVTVKAVMLAAFGLVFESLSTTVASIFQAYERLEYPVITKLVRILLRFLFTVPLLLKGTDFMTILAVYVLVQVIDFVLSMAICYRGFVALSFSFDRKLIVSLIRKSFPFLLSGIFVSVYFRIDITLMSKLAPVALAGFYTGAARDAVIGWYSSAYNLLDAATSLATAVSAAILPVAIAYFSESREKLVNLYNLSVRALMYLAVPLAVGTTLLADKIILFLYKAEYMNASLALKILIWTMIPLCINYMMGAVMIAMHEEKKGVIVLFLNVIVNVVLNLILIPAYSLYGAAVATVLTEVFYFCGYYYIISRSLSGLNFPRIFLKPAASSVLMAFAINMIGSLSLFIQAAVGILVYSGAMFLLGAFGKEDMALLSRLIGKA